MLTRSERDLRMGIWRIHVLHHAAQRDVWGAWLLHELAEHGHRLSPGTLYPALARLERHGWLRRVGRPGHARSRQSFRITEAGRRVLARLRQDVSELYAEVVMGLEPKRNRRASAPGEARDAVNGAAMPRRKDRRAR